MLDVLARQRPRLNREVRRFEDPESVPNDGYRLLDDLRDKVGGLLLLTATPMQLHDFELYSMIELVEPGLFGGYRDFADSREEIARINRAVTVLRSPRTQQGAIDECLELLRSYDASTDLLEAATAGPEAREIAALWLSRCHRLSEALVRNRKVEIGGFTKRIAHRIDVDPGEAELKLERDVQAYIRGRFASTDPNKRTAVGLVLVAFQKMACSSTRALAGALETRAARLLNAAAEEEHAISDDADMAETERALVELPSNQSREEAETLQRLAARAKKIDDAKLDAVDDLVAKLLGAAQGEKVLIFSQFLGTIEMIRERLARKHLVQVFHGNMSRDEKDKAHQAFRGPIQVLVSSEAGGEGRNFQFCHNIVNYDLPWNPMKIEQRIGRVDRVGQKEDVQIFNLAARGMLDERILDVLEYRIKLFTETVGALDPILESLEDEIGKIALGAEGTAEAAFKKLDEELESEIRMSLRLEELRRDFVLDWRSLQRDAAGQILGRLPRATRNDLEQFCRTAIERSGQVGGVEPSKEGGTYIKVPGIIRLGRKAVEEDYRGSFEVAEALRDERLHFFAMGHPLVEAILDTVGDPWWLPLTAFESEEWQSEEPALLVDYKIDLFGIRNSGRLVSHLVTETDVRPPVSIIKPNDPLLELQLPTWSRDLIDGMAKRSWAAARAEAIRALEAYKEDHAAIVEAELDRLNRMFRSRRGFHEDRVTRLEREVARLEREGTASQQRIIPARKGQIAADHKRLAELEDERMSRVSAVQAEIPAHRLDLLSVAMIAPKGQLRKWAT
jgi:ATP-dependent helicase HepA